MPNHMIEVDDDVMAYLRTKAEPFVDTPNSVLRRVLLAASVSKPGRAPGVVVPVLASSPSPKVDIPFGMPEALRQTLEVVSYMRRSGVDRNSATLFVAKSHNIARETVSDKYCRQMGLTAAQLDRLLSEPSLEQFAGRLRSKFPAFATQIRTVLAALPQRPTG